MIITVIIIGILGLIIGSFLNVVVYRLKKGGEIVWRRSYCPKCEHSLNYRDLVPLFSFLYMGGKCRYCHSAISWQYPLVELTTAIIFILGYLKYLYPSSILEGNATDQLLVYVTFLIFSSFLLIIFVYDLKHYLILDKVTIPALIVALVLNYWLGMPLLNLILAAVVVAGFFLLQFIVSAGKWIGGGDIRLGLVMGVMLGWPKVLVALFLAYILGAVLGLSLIALKKKQWHSQLPFGTFLSLATVITLLYGEGLLAWYLSSI